MSSWWNKGYLNKHLNKITFLTCEFEFYQKYSHVFQLRNFKEMCFVSNKCSKELHSTTRRNWSTINCFLIISTALKHWKRFNSWASSNKQNTADIYWRTILVADLHTYPLQICFGAFYFCLLNDNSDMIFIARGITFFVMWIQNRV